MSINKIITQLFAVLIFLTLLSACNQHTTDEFIKVNVNFEDVDWYAKRAQLAYKTEEEIHRSLDKVIHVENIPGKDILFFIEQLPDERQLISVRGTANFVNVREDVEYKKSRNDKVHILVHEGFDEDTNAVFQQALPHLDKNQEILTTGHSLGAAVSTLLMIYLYHDGYTVGPSINFGQPKFTNRTGAEKYDFLELTRIVNKEDVVPLLPPATVLSSVHGEYRHFGQEIILLTGPHFVYLDNHIVTEKDLSELWFNLDNLSVEDHKISNYRNSIQTKFKRQLEVPYTDRHSYFNSK